MTKPTLRDLQAAMNYGAPSGGMVRPPAFMERTPRQQSGKKRAHPEEDLQIACCQFLETQRRILYWSVPNHLFMGKPTPQKLGYLAKQKRMGLRKGVSDLHMFFRSKYGQPTFVCAELKAGYNKPDEEQQAYMDAVNERGGYTGVVRSIEDLEVLLRSAGF